MNRVVKMLIYAIAIPLIAAACLTINTYAVEPANIVVDAAAKEYPFDNHPFYFTADRDGGYTVEFEAPNYISAEIKIYEWKDGDYELLNWDITLKEQEGCYTGINEKTILSLYGRKSHSYMVEIKPYNAEGYDPANFKLIITHSNKACVIDGVEYWSDNYRGEELATAMFYRGNSSTVNVLGYVGGMRVGTIFNDFLNENGTVEKLIVAEGVQVIRNNVATRCTKLREVELPSTLEDLSNTPFSGCILNSIRFPKGNPWFEFRDSFLLTTGKNLTGYYGSASEVHVPNGIYQIEGRAFSNTNLEKLYLPESVKVLNNQHIYIDEIHTKSSMLDISLWTFGNEGEPIPIGTIYGPKGSQIEEMAKRYGINFVPEGVAVQ